ncbi:MAG: GNAT family N-acetyltransferase [Rhodoferax sp.]|nr:GNAT family N-acetyltransferase [Rhodoferax sp.]
MSADAPMAWKLSAFDALSVHELYELLQLRTEVFVLEQNCVFQDMDGADAQAVHLMGRHDGQLLAYARCFPAGVKFAEVSIGRVVTHKRVRGSGLGHLLIEQALAAVATLWGRQPVRIGAQTRLKNFYTGHGFADVGIAYVEDGIEHLEMIWQP